MKKILILIFIFVMAVSGCSSQIQGDTPTNTPEQADISGDNHSPISSDLYGTSQATVYPVTITNYNFAKEPIEITFEKAPEKVLAVYQNSIGTLLVLGLEDKILACSGLDHNVKPEYADAFAKVNYLTEFAPDKETVMMMEPDFILSWSSYFGEKRLGDVDYWHENGINTYIASNTAQLPRTLDKEYIDILNMGIIFNVNEKTEKIVNEIKAEVKKVSDHSDTIAEKPLVAIIEILGDSISHYGENSLGGDMVIKLGGLMNNPEGKTIGKEDLVALDPDVIFMVYMDRDNVDMAQTSIDLIMKDPVFESLKAVQNNRVNAIQLGEMYCSGVRTIDGIKIFAKGMYPEFYN